MTEAITFYNGAPVDSQQFAAVASFDALESPTEPSGTAVLLSFSMGTGWTVNRIEDEIRVADVSAFELGSPYRQPFALTEDGRILGFEQDSADQQIEGLSGAKTRAFAQSAHDNFIIGNFGYYFRADPEFSFTLMTDRHILPPPEWDAEDDEWDAHFRSQSFIMNADADPSGRIAMTEIGKLMFLETDFSVVKVEQPRILVGVTYDASSRQFWFCGHSPLPIVGRETAPGRIETVFTGPQGAHTFTDLAVYQGQVFLADTDLNAGGLFVLSASGDGRVLQKVDLPQEFGELPVWKVENQDGILWVLRTKDLLRLDGTSWQRFEIPNAQRP